MKTAAVDDVFYRPATSDPEPTTEIQYVNDYTLLVGVVLSAQATDIGVNKATRDLFETVRTPQAMLELGEEGLKQHIKTIGLFNAKAKNVIALSRILVDESGGEVPQSRDLLETLPGVGRTTAHVLMHVDFGEATHAVDTPTSPTA